MQRELTKNLTTHNTKRKEVQKIEELVDAMGISAETPTLEIISLDDCKVYKDAQPKIPTRPCRDEKTS